MTLGEQALLVLVGKFLGELTTESAVLALENRLLSNRWRILRMTELHDVATFFVLIG